MKTENEYRIYDIDDCLILIDIAERLNYKWLCIHSAEPYNVLNIEQAIELRDALNSIITEISPL